MAVIPPGDGLYNIPEVLLATDTGTIIVVDDKEAQDQLLENGPFNRMEVSPNGEVVACFNDQGTLFVMSTDFTKKLSKFGTNSKVPPRDVVWCGQSSVVLYWDKILLMVGPYGDFVKYSYDSALSLITECDGVRIITRDTCEFLSLVHESTESIFNIGSTTSAALLYDAYEAFEAKSVKADENVRLINQKDGELNEAIAINLCASTYEFKIDTQKLLLKTASYGKLNSTNFPTDVFTETCKSIRVLNAIRHLDVGMPLTIEQYNKLSADRLIDLLIIHHHHLLSLRVCDYLDMPVAKRVDILTHWACAKIKADDDLEDRELTSLIANKMTLCEG